MGASLHSSTCLTVVSAKLMQVTCMGASLHPSLYLIVFCVDLMHMSTQRERDSTSLYILLCSVQIWCWPTQWARDSTSPYILCSVQIWYRTNQWAQDSTARHPWITTQSSTDSQWADGHHAGHWAGGVAGHRNPVGKRSGGGGPVLDCRPLPTSPHQILHSAIYVIYQDSAVLFTAYFKNSEDRSPLNGTGSATLFFITEHQTDHKLSSKRRCIVIMPCVIPFLVWLFSLKANTHSMQSATT